MLEYPKIYFEISIVGINCTEELYISVRNNIGGNRKISPSFVFEKLVNLCMFS